MVSIYSEERKWAISEAEVQEEISADQDKCIKQLALSADRNAKFLSSQQKASLSTAKNAT